MADPKITPTGMDQGDLVQLLYEVVYVLINSVAGATASDFTVDIQNRAGSITGKNG